MGLPGFYTPQRRRSVRVGETFPFTAVSRPPLAENVQTRVLNSDSSADHGADQPYENVWISVYKILGDGGGVCAPDLQSWDFGGLFATHTLQNRPSRWDSSFLSVWVI